jgi:pimeloyl-[acyl-carrier protein] methyl ester esterase
MGGMVGLDWAQRFPAEVAGVILLNSSTGDQPVSWRLRPRAWPLMLAALVLPIAMREPMVLRQVSNCADLYPVHSRVWLRLQLLHPVSRRTLMTMLVAAARFRPRAQCNAPGLVLASEADRLVNVKASLELATRFAWPCILHPHGGHDLPLDAPDWLVKEVSHWLTGRLM